MIVFSVKHMVSGRSNVEFGLHIVDVCESYYTQLGRKKSFEKRAWDSMVEPHK